MFDTNRKVVISGMGLLTPIGVEIKEQVTNLKSGHYAEAFDLAGDDLLTGRIPSFQASAYINNRKAVRQMNRQTLLGCCSANIALSSSGIENADLSNDRSGIIFGAAVLEGSIVTAFDAIKDCFDSEGDFDYERLGHVGIRNLPPLWILPRLPNTTAGQISILNSVKGLNLSIVNGGNSGMIAIGEAYENIKSGRNDRIVAGGAEGELYPDLVFKLYKRGLVAKGAHGSLSFDQASQGMLLSEGAASLVLEAEESAKAREAVLYGEVLSFTNFYIPDYKNLDETGLVYNYEKCMRKALEQAQIKPEEVDFIEANGCGINKMDRGEAAAIKRIFGKDTPVTCPQSFVGNTLAASGAVAAAFAALQLSDDCIPPIVRSHSLYLENDINYVRNYAINKKSRYCLINSFDYYGSACSLVISRIGG